MEKGPRRNLPCLVWAFTHYIGNSNILEFRAHPYTQIMWPKILPISPSSHISRRFLWATQFPSDVANLAHGSSFSLKNTFVNTSAMLSSVWIFLSCTNWSSNANVEHNQWYVTSICFEWECYIKFFLMSIALWLDHKRSHKFVDEMARGGTTSPHAGCFLLTSHPPFVVGHKIRLVLAGDEGH